jgi:hypothetical protein
MAESRKPPVTASPDEADAEAIMWTLLLRSEVRDSEFRQALLLRDGYRCCITRWLEQKKWLDNGMPANELHAFLEAAPHHSVQFCGMGGKPGIFSRNPMELSHELWADSTQDTKEASDWGEVVVRCFPTLLNCRLTTRMINSPSNGMMLVGSLHKAFASFHMAFARQ